MFYKLDEIVYQFLKSDGDVVALTLDYMSRNSAIPFSYSPEIRFDGNGLAAEIDLCAVWDGELTIGEAKSIGELAPSVAEARKVAKKYAHLAKMLNASRVVFSTTSTEWKESTIDAVRTAFSGGLAVPHFLTKSQILG